MSPAVLLLAAAAGSQMGLAPAEHYSLAKLLEAGFELKAAAPSAGGDTLYLQGRLGPGKPQIIVRCGGQTIAVAATDDCRRVY